MRLVTYESSTGPRPGVLAGDAVCDLRDAFERAGLGEAPDSVRGLLTGHGADDQRRLGEAAAALAAEGARQLPRLDELALLPPVPDPQKIICLALNSKRHCEEASIPKPPEPWFFPKWQNSLLGHNGVISPPPVSEKVDWEGEVAIVIGRVARAVSEADALDHVAGVMPFNDVSCRDLLGGLETIAICKAGDTQAPCGPALVTLDEIDDLDDLPFRTIVNGDVKQDGSTSDYIFSAAATIAFLSRTMTLVPGDVIALGTLLGVGLFLDPPQFLGEGDVVEIVLDGVGTLRNVVGPPSTEPVLAPTAGRASERPVA